MTEKFATYRKSNGDLNIDVEKLLETFPELRFSACDDEEQKVFSVALVPYMCREINSNTKRLEDLNKRVSDLCYSPLQVNQQLRDLKGHANASLEEYNSLYKQFVEFRKEVEAMQRSNDTEVVRLESKITATGIIMFICVVALCAIAIFFV